MPAALIDRPEEIDDEAPAPTLSGSGRHRREVSWAERAAQMTPRIGAAAVTGRHRRRRKSALLAAGTPALVAGAVAVTATTGTLNLNAGSADGSEGDLGIRTAASEALRQEALAARATGDRATRDDGRGLLGNLLGDLGATEEAAQAPSTMAEAPSVSSSSRSSASTSGAKSSATSGAKSSASRSKVVQKRKPTKVAPAFVKPIQRYRLTARFGQSGSRWSRDHTGLDFAAPHGSPVRAVASGTVVSAGWAGAYGLRTVIRHADGTRTWYAHQSRLIVRHGKVKAGQIIGRVGSTGNSTGPHMHLEVHRYGKAVNPATWLRTHGVRV